MKKLQIPCEVLDKRTHDGWFGSRSYYVTFRFISHTEREDSPIISPNPSVAEYETGAETYYRMGFGKIYAISFVQTEDGKWTIYRPGNED